MLVSAWNNCCSGHAQHTHTLTRSETPYIQCMNKWALSILMWSVCERVFFFFYLVRCSVFTFPSDEWKIRCPFQYCLTEIHGFRQCRGNIHKTIHPSIHLTEVSFWSLFDHLILLVWLLWTSFESMRLTLTACPYVEIGSKCGRSRENVPIFVKVHQFSTKFFVWLWINFAHPQTKHTNKQINRQTQINNTPMIKSENYHNESIRILSHSSHNI